MTLNAKTALGGLPATLRTELLDEYDKIVRNYRERRWEATELNGGRFCEIVYSILKGVVDGKFPTTSTKPNRFADACADLAKTPKAAFPQSVRLGIPRVLVSLYEIRNNRGVGHVGGEVDANHMDSTIVLHSAQWVMAELVRLFHDTDTDAASAVVDALVERTIPVIWEVDGKKRVLATNLTLAKMTLLLVYSEPTGRSEADLVADLEQKSPSDYRRVLTKLHASRLIEYREDKIVLISPNGIALVEDELLPAL